MKKAGYFIILLLEILLYAGAYVFQYFTRKKLGMSRYVVFLNSKIKEAVPIQSIIYGGILLIIILLVLAAVLYWKRRERLGKLPAVMAGVSVLTSAFYMYYALANSVETMRAYYVLSVLLLAAGVLQLLKTLTACMSVTLPEKSSK